MTACREAIAFLNDPVTGCEVGAERAFLKRLGGGCQLPIAGYAKKNGGTHRAGGAGRERRRAGDDPRCRSRGPPMRSTALGTGLADEILAAGRPRPPRRGLSRGAGMMSEIENEKRFMTKQGRVTIIGAGPGDPGLITLRGAQCIREADVIVYDHLVGPEILRHAGEKARLIYAGKQGGKHTLSQGEINDLLVEEARKGRSSPGSRGAIPSSSAGAAKRRRSSGRRASPSRSSPGSPPRSPCPPMRGSRSPTGAIRPRWPSSRAMRIRPRGRAASTGRRSPGSGRWSSSWRSRTSRRSRRT